MKYNSGCFKKGDNLGNQNGFKKGQVPWNKGIGHLKDDRNPLWKGDKVGYRGLHMWLRRKKDGGDKCEFCGKLKTTPKSIHLANKTGKYLRDINDWLWLCVSCHKKYDINRHKNTN